LGAVKAIAFDGVTVEVLLFYREGIWVFINPSDPPYDSDMKPGEVS
jgi:hypothetical protein